MSFFTDKARIYERITYTQPNGAVYKLHSPPDKVVMDMTGWGKPPHTMYATSGPYQHGTSPVAYRLDTRSIDFTILHKFCNRSEWWAGRTTLLSNLGIAVSSPDNPVPGVLTWTYVVNNRKIVRCLDCFLTKGLIIDPLQGRPYTVQETLSFEALNPVVYEPVLNTVNLISSLSAGLVLPMTFPFILGAYSSGGTAVTYSGTWESFPTITIVGPATDVYIENVTTGSKIRLDYSVSVGETVTINLLYDKKTITNNFGDNLAPYIHDSDLGQFSLQYSPIVSGGTNTILVILDGYAAGTTAITLSYYNRYYGI